MNRAFLRHSELRGIRHLKSNKKWTVRVNQKLTLSQIMTSGFPNIKRILSKHKHILEYDNQCRILFPQNCLRVTHRRRHRNLKEWLAPSNVSFREVTGISHDEPNPGCTRCGKCGKDPQGRKRASGIYNCQVMKEANKFKSKVTGESYKIRQRIDCSSKDVIYLVECRKCRKQGVGSTEDFKLRVSSYISHILKERPTYKTVQHFCLIGGELHCRFQYNWNCQISESS